MRWWSRCSRPTRPRVVGIWMELDAGEPTAAAADDRIRHVRGLASGFDSIPEVEAIVVPCLPAMRDLVMGLFADPIRPGRLVSDKLRVIAAGRDPVRSVAVADWAHRHRERSRDRLASIGVTASPRSWPAALGRPAQGAGRRAFGTPRTIVKILKHAVRFAVCNAVLATLRRLPPHATAVAQVRRHGPAAAWILSAGSGGCGWRLPGPKILDLCGSAPVAGDAGLRRFIRRATGVVVPSRYAADAMAGIVGGRGGPRVTVVPPAPLLAVDPLPDRESRRRLGEDLRELFRGDTGRPLHRHFCDFPFEHVEYLVAVPSNSSDAPLLSAYATVVRRHRCDLKLLVDGRLQRGDGPVSDIAAAGLCFDVAEAAGLAVPARLRLLRHARVVVVPALDTGAVPAIFAEAVAVGVPVVMGRLPATREFLTTSELAGGEYFDPASGPGEGIARAILHVLGHRDEVLARQRAIVTRLATRTWAGVAAEQLALLSHA